MPLDADLIADAAAEAVAPIFRRYRETIDALEARLASLETRLAQAETREPLRGERGEKGEPGPAGKDADIEELAARLLPEIEKAVSQLPPPERGEPGEKGEPGPQGDPGRDADPEAVKALLLPEIEQMIPAPLKGEKGDPGDRGPEGEPGKDTDPEVVRQIVWHHVKQAVDELPPPPKGEKGDPGDPGVKGEKGDPGTDGVGLSGAMIDRSGALVLTLRDGTVHHLGSVVGKDGEPGEAGRDGLGFDDPVVEHDGHRGFSLVFERGAERKVYSFTLPVVLDCGVYKESERYDAGDGVTWGGSYWIAQKSTTQKPGDGDEWRLSIKKGRDGRAPEMDAFLERSMPKIVERLAPVIHKAIKDRKDG